MELKSSAFNQGEKIPVKYTCDGDDFSPPLEISGVPENTKSLVLIVDDPDAPVGTWVHWVVWNIQPKITKIEENTVPVNAIEGINDFGKHNYGGPCPPSGTHRYFFKSYALDKTLELDNNAKKSDVENAMRGHVIEQATLIGTYSRS
ncbi:MAG: YbhB/YbcL family Raf kinase inhibitor-like protein [Nanoarchaeota archaeon]|nr:YbhB/YbcL family Raf kinase inhibitor-like protein [Nanoarchaeota archaeon]